MFYSFEPIFDNNSEILILGSFPSVLSRENKFYYGNPKNRFWATVSKIFNYGSLNSIDEKKAFLLSEKIALWDIVDTCDIKGSLDGNLKNITVVNLNIILNETKIKKIFCNGKTAFNLANKFYPRLKDITVYLPSTSPANTKFSFGLWEEAFDKWKRQNYY